MRKLIQSMNWIENLQSFRSQIACSKNQTVWDLIQSINKIELFQKFWSSRSLVQKLNLFGNWFRVWNHLECFIFWNSCRRNSIFANRFKRWNELVNSKTRVACFRIWNFSETDFVYETICNVSYFKFLAEKTQTFGEPMQYLKRIEIFQFSKLRKLAYRTQSNLEPIQSKKWSEMLDNFIDQIACFKTDYLANRFNLGSEFK